MKLKFKSYYKYSFAFEDEAGGVWYCGGDGGDIYRFSVDVENMAVKIDDVWMLDGLILTKSL